MFRTMAKDKDFCEEILRVILSDPKLTDHGEMFENIPVTSGSKCRYKETEEGQQVMCKIMERLVDENIERVNTLNSILIELNRLDDLKRATRDKDFQMQLMIELLPKDV